MKCVDIENKIYTYLGIDGSYKTEKRISNNFHGCDVMSEFVT